LTLWFFFYVFFLGGHWDLFSRGGTGVCFSPVEGGLGFVYSYGRTSILFFFSTADFFFYSRFGGGGDHGPSRSPHRSVSGLNNKLSIMVRSYSAKQFCLPTVTPQQTHILLKYFSFLSPLHSSSDSTRPPRPAWPAPTTQPAAYAQRFI
jgi:hypothetical protein